jgi:hypothetical protein
VALIIGRLIDIEGVGWKPLEECHRTAAAPVILGHLKAAHALRPHRSCG